MYTDKVGCTIFNLYVTHWVMFNYKSLPGRLCRRFDKAVMVKEVDSCESLKYQHCVSGDVCAGVLKAHGSIYCLKYFEK